MVFVFKLLWQHDGSADSVVSCLSYLSHTSLSAGRSETSEKKKLMHKVQHSSLKCIAVLKVKYEILTQAVLDIVIMLKTMWAAF